jgi:hypothetical protein
VIGGGFLFAIHINMAAKSQILFTQWPLGSARISSSCGNLQKIKPSRF